MIVIIRVPLPALVNEKGFLNLCDKINDLEEKVFTLNLLEKKFLRQILNYYKKRFAAMRR